MVGDGENEGRPESRSRRSASVHGAIPGAASEIGGDLVGRNRPDEAFGTEKESMVSLYGPRRMVAHGAGGRGGRAHTSRCPAWKVRGLRFVGGGERMVVVGRKGRETSPSKQIHGIECSRSLSGW